ncbi:MAG: Crp/Fnr family transcriptional regulator [Deltaproteobacteria bacterium]|nr:Crp/Fnr family transcriptional regulator [Deltaproteobacteria bacterium]
MQDQPALLERFGRHFPTDALLFREGDLGREMYLIQSGRVQISRFIQGRTSVLADLGPGDFFGEMALLNHRPRSATAMAMEPTIALVLDADTFKAMITSNAEIALRLLEKLAHRLEMANTQIELLLVQDANHRVVYTLRKMAELTGKPQGAGILIPTSVPELAGRLGLDEDQVRTSILRLQEARLVRATANGFLIPEVGKLHEYLDFLDIRRRNEQE